MTDLLTPDLLVVLDRLVQWVILPAAAMLFAHNRRINRIDAEILRILTILEERANARTEDREAERATFNDLKAALDRLTDRLDRTVDK